jgi:hypothetical protein
MATDIEAIVLDDSGGVPLGIEIVNYCDVNNIEANNIIMIEYQNNGAIGGISSALMIYKM